MGRLLPEMYSWSCFPAAFLISFPRKLRLEIGGYFDKSSGEVFLFLIRGVTTAFFIVSGMTPDWRLELITSVMLKNTSWSLVLAEVLKGMSMRMMI